MLYAQLDPNAIARIPGAVLGTNEKCKLLDFITDFNKKQQDQEAMVAVTAMKDASHFFPSYSLGDRTRTFLKVQDGCNDQCTFCTIPLARGSSRSATIPSVLEQAQAIAQKNVKEIVLTGVNLGDFGLINNKRTANFLTLIQVLDTVEGIARFRISSIEPNLLHEAIIAFVAQSKRFVPHFHIPLQSGSDKILKLMRRRYTKLLYQKRIEAIKECMPTCCIGVDIIVGFPGETE